MNTNLFFKIWLVIAMSSLLSVRYEGIVFRFISGEVMDPRTFPKNPWIKERFENTTDELEKTVILSKKPEKPGYLQGISCQGLVYAVAAQLATSGEVSVYSVLKLSKPSAPNGRQFNRFTDTNFHDLANHNLFANLYEKQFKRLFYKGCELLSLVVVTQNSYDFIVYTLYLESCKRKAVDQDDDKLYKRFYKPDPEDYKFFQPFLNGSQDKDEIQRSLDEYTGCKIS